MQDMQANRWEQHNLSPVPGHDITDGAKGS